MSDSGANKIFQGGFVDLGAFVEVNGARRFRIKASVEETVWIFQRSALKEIQLDMVFESADGNDIPLMRPDRRAPLPFFDDVWISCQDQLARRASSLPRQSARSAIWSVMS